MAANRRTFGKDNGLQARMVLTMFLLGLVYVVFIGVLFAAGAGAGLIVVVAAVLLLGPAVRLRQARDGARWALKEVTPERGARAARRSSSACACRPICRSRGSCVIETPMPNAFALGSLAEVRDRLPPPAASCEMLSPAELEGVMAHELTHVINRDVMVMTLASFFASLASMILQFAFFFGGGYGGDEEERDDHARDPRLRHRLRRLLLLLRALSRYREFAADRGSAVLTGRPSALASALIKISGAIERARSQDLRRAEGMQRLLHHPRARQEVADEPVRRPSAARAAPRGARSAWSRSCRAA